MPRPWLTFTSVGLIYQQFSNPVWTLSMLEFSTEKQRSLKAFFSQEDLPVDIAFGYSHALAGYSHLILDTCYVNKVSPHFALPRYLRQWFSNFKYIRSISEGLLQPRLLGNTPRVSDSVGQGWGGGGNQEFAFLTVSLTLVLLSEETHGSRNQLLV